VRPFGLSTWMELRALGNSRAVQASVLFPVVGYLILFNDQVSTFLSISRLENAQPTLGVLGWAWSHKLHFIYFGLMSLGLGSFIYSFRCPFIIKKHGDFADYVRIDGPSISDETAYEYRQILGIPAQSKADILHHWYAQHSAQRPFSRIAVTILFAVGLALLAVPSFISALKIAALLKG
jgi:hypothetical protein